nr:MAG TPA: hypothetical protein [Caudoviricetes sp.]
MKRYNLCLRISRKTVTYISINSLLLQAFRVIYVHTKRENNHKEETP